MLVYLHRLWLNSFIVTYSFGWLACLSIFVYNIFLLFKFYHIIRSMFSIFHSGRMCSLVRNFVPYKIYFCCQWLSDLAKMLILYLQKDISYHPTEQTQYFKGKKYSSHKQHSEMLCFDYILHKHVKCEHKNNVQTHVSRSKFSWEQLDREARRVKRLLVQAS